MKTKSTSQLVRLSLGEGGFLNLRVLFGLCVMLAGIFLALVSFGPATTGFAQGTTREKMAVELAQALNIQPPACVADREMFNDVPASSPFCSYIEELSRRGITGGCGGGNFCPADPVTRQQMAVFLVKAVDAVTQSEAFHIVGTAGEPPFQNGWHNFGGGFSTGGFFKDALGIVHLKGNLTGGTGNGSTAFTLPEGYRPAEALVIPAAGGVAGPVAANVAVLQDGQLQPTCQGLVACAIGMDSLAFRVP
jgi:S-layer homology domain